MNLFETIAILLADDNCDLIISSLNLIEFIFFIKKISVEKYHLYIEEFFKCNGF